MWLSALFDALPGQAVFLVDSKGLVVRVNPGVKAVMGVGVSEVVGRPLHEILPSEVACRREAHRYELEMETPSGRLIPAQVSVAPVPPHSEDGEGAHSVEQAKVVVVTDQTDLIRARRALIDTQLRLRALFERGVAGIAMFDASGRFLRVNPAFCELLGYSRAELLARSIVDVVAHDYKVQAKVYFEATARGLPTTSNEEVCYQRKDGSPLWLRVSAHPITDPFSSERMVVAEVRDVTDARRRRHALQSITRGLGPPVTGDVLSWTVSTAASALDAACVYVSSTELGSDDGSPTTLASYGDLSWVPNDSGALGDTPCDAVRAGGLVYLPTVDAADGRYRELMERSGVRSYIGIPVPVTDDRVAVLAVLDVRAMPSDLPIELWSILRTFAERVGAQLERMSFRERFEHSADQFRALLETAAEIFLLTDRKGRIVEVAEHTSGKLRYERDALCELSLADLDLDGKTEGLPGALGVGEPRVVETRLRRGDGTELHAELIVCLVDWAGERVGLVLARDISERRRIEEARRRFVEDIVTAQEEERARVARELHDSLGQVLTSLSLQLRSVADQTRDPAAYTHLRRLLKLSEAATKEAGSLAQRLRPPALDDLGVVAAIREHVREVAGHHGVRADVYVRGYSREVRLPPHIETALYRIVQEALTNVLKHAAASNVSILLDRRPERVRLVVEDDGCGFDPEAPRPNRAGGLGLAGIRERATLLGGDLRIESRPGEGTAIYVTLPLLAEDP